MVWVCKTTGIFDPVKKIYRRDNSRYFRKGVPDILGIHKGRPLAIEVKSLKGRVSPDQEKFIEEFNVHGGVGIIARSLFEVMEVLAPELILSERPKP